jgi:hypothetical protein
MNDSPVVVEYEISWPDRDAIETATFTIPRAEWDAMTPAERTARIETEVEAIVGSTVGYGWHIHNEDDWARTEEPS